MAREPVYFTNEHPSCHRPQPLADQCCHHRASLLATAILTPGTAHAEAFSDAAGRGVLSAFLFAFTAGFLTSLTPCVYPMIPITIGVFGGRGGCRASMRLPWPRCTWRESPPCSARWAPPSRVLGRAFGTSWPTPGWWCPSRSSSSPWRHRCLAPSTWRCRPAATTPWHEWGPRLSGRVSHGLVGGLIAAPCTGRPWLEFSPMSQPRAMPCGLPAAGDLRAGIGVPFWAIAGFSASPAQVGRVDGWGEEPVRIALTWACTT